MYLMKAIQKRIVPALLATSLVGGIALAPLPTTLANQDKPIVPPQIGKRAATSKKKVKPAPPAPFRTNSKYSKNQSQFAWKLLRQIRKDNPKNDNQFVSPLSILLCVSMGSNGAQGETRREMTKALSMDGWKIALLNRRNQQLQTYLPQANPGVQLSLANSLWGSKRLAFEQSFLQTLAQRYRAQVQMLNFGSPQAVKTINRWVDSETNHKISKILNRTTPADVMILINAIYFKGDWSHPFKKKYTRLHTFTTADGSSYKHPTMFRSSKYQYLQTKSFQMVNLPYGPHKNCHMTVVLPRPGKSLEQLLSQIDGAKWNRWQRQMSGKPGQVGLPKFKLACSYKLKPTLWALGMRRAFTMGANFGGMTKFSDVLISQVYHKTYVEVNEKGTEAAAVTAMVGRAGSPRPITPFKMVVDRPFLCVIQDKNTGAILFAGTIGRPEVK